MFSTRSPDIASPLESEEKLAEAQLEQPGTHDALQGEEVEDSKFAKRTMHVFPNSLSKLSS